jgi:translation initiation factor IF-2
MAGENINNSKRSPVIVVLGHVDHGKTSLLDWIRKTKVAEKEAGGITQSIGAYEISHTPANSTEARRLTFIDTPGHEAFRAMRERGATVADVAILVVAADEGVEPQTEESIRILQETGTPFVVAITKIDRPGANVEKVQNDLLSIGVFLEGRGGDTSWQGVSSKTGEGINELLDLIALLSDLLDLTYDPAANASGFILEAKKDSRRGIVVSLVLKNGIIRQGQEIATRTAEGKIRNLENFSGKVAKELVPSSPALVVGFNEMPLVGEEFLAGEVKLFKFEPKEIKKISAEEGREGLPPAILKADVAGTLEVLESVLVGKVNIISSSAGEITDGDVKAAVAAGAVIVGFRVAASRGAENLAKNQSIRIFSSEIIYELVKKVEEYIEEGKEEEFTGRLRILGVFGKKDGQQIIGGRVFEGLIRNQEKFFIYRNDSRIGEGKIINLQRNRADVQELNKDEEGGLLVNSPITIREGDEISQRTA